MTAEEIGAEARRRIEDVLASIGHFPLREGFLGRIEAFAGMLSLWGSRHNLTAVPENPSELAFHIVDSLTPVIVMGSIKDWKDLFDSGKRVLDLGSGAGLPGLVLAAATDAEFTLLESRRKRVSFLRVAAAEMRLENVRIEAAHLGPEDLRPSFDAVVGRAFAKPLVFVSTALAALRPSGCAILYANRGEAKGLDSGPPSAFELPYEIKRDELMMSRRLLIWIKE